MIDVLGHSRFCKIRNLVNIIRSAKIKKVATLGCNGKVCGRAFDSNLPLVVKRIYFETTLVQAFEQYPVEQMRSLDWDLLTTEAEQNLLDFQQWEANHTVSSGLPS